MAGYFTYEPLLRGICKKLTPLSILEWGPGLSTKIMVQECPEAKILSIEHSKEYFRKAREEFRENPNIEIIHVQHTLAPGESEGYVTYPLQKLLPGRIDVYDLIFVDGRSRCDCLLLSYLLCSPNGIVILHDSERPNYKKGLAPFPYVFCRDEESIGVSMAAKNLSRFHMIKEVLDHE